MKVVASCCLFLILAAGSLWAAVPAPHRMARCPARGKLAWQELEAYGFLHFGVEHVHRQGMGLRRRAGDAVQSHRLRRRPDRPHGRGRPACAG